MNIFFEEPLNVLTSKYRIVLPRAIKRHVTFNKSFTTSWFDIKTYENSFSKPFEEVFSAEEIAESTLIIK